MLFNVCMIFWWQVAESFLVFHGFVTKFYVSFVLSSIVINTMGRVSWSLCWLSCLCVHVLWFHVLHLFSLSRIRAVIFDCDTPRWSFFSDFISKRLSFGSKEVTQINWARSWVAVDNATLLIVSSVMLIWYMKLWPRWTSSLTCWKVNRTFQEEPQTEAASDPRHQDKHKDQLPLPQARWSKC